MISAELRRIVDVNVPDEEIVKCLVGEVIKRDTLEGPCAVEAASRVKKALKKVQREKAEASSSEVTEAPAEPAECIEDKESKVIAATMPAG